MKSIAISGISGSGKSTLIKALKHEFSRVAVLSFDDYSFDTQFDNYYDLMAEHADYNLLDLSLLKDDIEKLKNSGDVSVLLLDYPFSYKNDLIKPYIDLSIFMDTPLDIALSRRLIRDYTDSESCLRALHDYLNHSRKRFVTYIDDIKNNADIICDGREDIDQIIHGLKVHFASL